LDDHSRLAYTEILPDETRDNAVAFWRRAQAFFGQVGVTVQRVLTDNGSCYRSRLWRDTLTATTPPSAAHPPAAYPTSLGRTPSAARG